VSATELIDFVPRLRRIASKIGYRRSIADIEELESAGLIGLAKAHAEWKPERGKWEAFATIAVSNSIRDYLRTNRFRPRKGKHVPRVESLNAIDGAEAGHEQFIGYHEFPLARVEMQELFDAAMNGIKPRDRTVFWLRFVEGRRFDEIGHRFGKTKGWAASIVHNAIQIVQANANRHMKGTA